MFFLEKGFLRRGVPLPLLCVLFLFACGDSTHTVRSGHPYTHHIQNGGYLPQKGDLIRYHVTQRDGDQVKASSWEQGRPMRLRIPEIDPSSDKYNLRVSPVTEALMLMSEGDSLSLEVKADLLPEKPADMPAGSSMFMDLVLLEVLKASDIAAEEQALVKRGLQMSAETQKRIKAHKAGTLEGLEKTASGISYIRHKQGGGDRLPPDATVMLHYTGHLMDNGKQFSNSYSNKRPTQFKLGAEQVIEAWEEVLPTCSAGDEITLFVPYQKGYGVAGSRGLGVPEKADLAFFVEVVELK